MGKIEKKNAEIKIVRKWPCLGRVKTPFASTLLDGTCRFSVR